LNFLFQYDKELFENKKCPKIIYLSSFQESVEEIQKLKSNFEKIHNRYTDIESYFLNIFKNFSNFTELEDILDKYACSLTNLFPELEKDLSDKSISEEHKIYLIKNQLKKKPFLLFNKYGDVKAYSQNEFDGIADSEMIYNYFEKFSILNNKTDFLFINDYDFIFLIFLDGKKIDYTHPNFRLFRKIFFNLNFFNVKFFVCTNENKELFNISENEKTQNDIFLLKRKNIFNTKAFSKSNQENVLSKTTSESLITYKEFAVENEGFELINLTNDLYKNLDLGLENKNSHINTQKINIEGIVNFNKGKYY